MSTQPFPGSYPTTSTAALPATAFPHSEAAYAGLVRTYEGRIFRLCYRLLGDAAEAKDAVQDTFLRAYLHRSRFDPQRSLPTWLLTIAAHHCIDRLRRRRFQWLCLDNLDWAGHPALHAADPSPEEALIEKERVLEMSAVLSRLPARDREAIILHYWGSLSCAEVAAAMGSTVPAVKSLLHRGRARLANLLRRPPYSLPMQGSALAAAQAPLLNEGGSHA